VVGILLGVFVGLLVRKFVITDGPAAPAAESAPAVSNDLFATPQVDKPTVVTAQKDAAGQALGGADGGAWTRHDRGDTSDVPHGSFMPSEPQAETPAENSRYAQDQATEPDNSASAADAPAAPNPFSASEDSSQPESRVTAAPKAAPKALEVAPGGASALDARRSSERAKRNPLRRLSAEVPLNEASNTADFAGGTDDPAASDPQTAEPGTSEGGAAPSADNEFAQPAEPQAADPPATDPPAVTDELPDQMPAEEPQSRYDTPAAPAAEQPPIEQAPIEPALPADGRYTIQPNDNLWKISEKVYGTGRFFKAIHEHNRARMPYPDRLTAGEVIEVPPPGILEERYPELCPKQRRSAVVKTRTQPATPPRRSSGDTYMVEEGDTLFDIARYELGKASRWGEIYELNRDVLGEDFDYLQPGLELKLPSRNTGGEAVSQEPSSRYVR
jgi:nucleoid-associated protein YgaU